MIVGRIVIGRRQDTSGKSFPTQGGQAKSSIRAELYLRSIADLIVDCPVVANSISVIVNNSSRPLALSDGCRNIVRLNGRNH